MAEDIDARLRAVEQANAAANERDEMFERMFRELYPLVELYGRLDERFNVVLRDVGKAHEALRDLDEEIEQTRVDCKDQIDAAREERNAQIQVEREARESQHKDIRVQMLKIVGALFTTLLTVAGSVVVAYLAYLAAKGGGAK